MRIVVDTNVVVSGLLRPDGPPGRILDLLLSRHTVALFDDRILTEYRRVVARPRLGIDPAHATTVLDFIESSGELILAPPLSATLPDPSDLPFIEVAAAGQADALVTGNQRHFAAARWFTRVPVQTPAEFIDFWRARNPGGD